VTGHLLQLQKISEHLQSERREILEHAQSLVDVYWFSFTNQNREIAQRIKSGLTQEDINNIAPVIETRSHAGSPVVKVYIIWKLHSKKFRNNMKKAAKTNASLPIHPYTSEDARVALKKHCTWNLNMALELERQLIDIRTTLGAVHESHKRIIAGIRKLERQLQKETKHE